MNPRDQFARTVCSCPECVACCEEKPGMLIPADLDALIRQHFPSPAPRVTVDRWLTEHLLASEGALVACQGRLMRIPTIVPQRKLKNLGCVFLSPDSRCLVHAIAPFGCSHCDMHLSDYEGRRRSEAALRSIIEAFVAYNQPHGPADTAWYTPRNYVEVWYMLQSQGCVAEPLAVRQARLDRRQAQIRIQQQEAQHAAPETAST